MHPDIRNLLIRLRDEQQTGMLSLVIDSSTESDTQVPHKEALSLSFVAGELAAAESRGRQGQQALDLLARANRLLRERWYPVNPDVLKRMEGMPRLTEWMARVEAGPPRGADAEVSRAQRLDDILRAVHTMGGLDGIQRFVHLTGQHPPDQAWEPLMLALRDELALYLGEERAIAMTHL